MKAKELAVAKEKIMQVLGKNESTGINNLKKTLQMTTDQLYVVLKELEKEGKVTLKGQIVSLPESE